MQDVSLRDINISSRIFTAMMTSCWLMKHEARISYLILYFILFYKLITARVWERLKTAHSKSGLYNHIRDVKERSIPSLGWVFIYLWYGCFQHVHPWCSYTRHVGLHWSINFIRLTIDLALSIYSIQRLRRHKLMWVIGKKRL